MHTDTRNLKLSVDSCRAIVGTFSVTASDLTLRSGDVALVLGGNGSGKSTLLRALVGLHPAERNGSMCDFSLEELDTNKASHELFSRIGYLPQGDTRMRSYKVSDMIDLHKAVYKVSKPELMQRLDIEPLMKQTLETLSGGEYQLVKIYMALAHTPELLILDEPTTGLDTEHTAVFHQLVQEAVEGGAALLIVSHDPRSLQMANQVFVVNKGKLAPAAGTGSEQSAVHKDQWALRIIADSADGIKSVKGQLKASEEGKDYDWVLVKDPKGVAELPMFLCISDKRPDDVARRVLENCPYAYMELTRATANDLIASITGDKWSAKS